MTEKIVFDANWIKVKQTPKGYFFSERKGMNSLAILLYRKYKEDGYDFIDVLVRMQALPIDNAQSNDDADIPKLFKCPITGGIEGEKYRISEVRREVREEAGYDIPEVAFKYLGEYYVGTQTNEKVFMYIADVNTEGTERVDIKGDGSYFESISQNKWFHLSELLDTEYSGLNILANKLHRMWEEGVI